MEADVNMTELWSAVPGTRGYRVDPSNYFHGTKKLGTVDRRFINRISGPFICLIFTVLYHALSGWDSGEYELVAEFSYVNCGGR